jgi:hypothetical protein
MGVVVVVVMVAAVVVAVVRMSLLPRLLRIWQQF